MQDTVQRQSVNKWARDFYHSLDEASANNRRISQKRLGKNNINAIVARYREASSRLLIFDYDGTLTPIVANPALAMPSQRLLDLLSRLAADAKNTIAVCSGRDKYTLDRWLGGLPIFLSAEHGAFCRDGGIWNQWGESAVWDDEILQIFQNTVERTPHSRLERKNTALVWHYRQVDPWLADLRTSQLLEALVPPCSRLGLQIMPGRKIIEVKPTDFNKGNVVHRLLESGNYEFVMAMGDDTTDEDMFNALPEGGVSIKVGALSENARYWLGDPAQTQAFLERLTLG